MDKYLFFSGDKPTVEDENFSRDALINNILFRAKDLFTDGVVTGFALSKDGSDLVVSGGTAYRGGERIDKSSEHRESYPGTDKYVFVKYQTIVGGSPKTHHITGATHYTRQSHSSTIILKDTSTPENEEVLIGRALASGVVEDMRSYCEVVSDKRIHDQNTDTHTDAAAFRVGYVDEGDPGSIVLTVLDAITQHPELELLFRNGIINLQDGHGDRLIETRKIPSQPNAPSLLESNLSLKVHSTSPEKDVALRLALDNYLATKVSVEAIVAQLTLLTTYRSLVNQKRLLGYSLDQIRGDADVDGAKDNDVRNKKNDLIIAGAGDVSREAGTLSITSGSANVSGTGTSFDSSLEGKKILLHAEGLQKEYTVQTVNVPLQTLVLTEVAGETEPSAYFYKADATALGYGGGVSSGADMISEVDTHKAGKDSARSLLIEEKVSHGNSVLTLYTEDDEVQEDSYSLLLTWDKPDLVDLEEIKSYRIRVYELANTRTQIPQSISKEELEASHVDIIYRSKDFHTVERQKIEEQDATDVTTSGSTTTVIKLGGSGNFQPNTRVEVDGVSRVIKSVNAGEKTIELLTALDTAPVSGLTVNSYRIAWDGEVFTERYQQPVRTGQQLVIYAQAITEYDVASSWSTGLVVLTDDLEAADSKKLSELVAERMSTKKLRFEVERDRLALEYQEQIFALQRAVAEGATQEQLDSVVGAVEELQTPAS